MRVDTRRPGQQEWQGDMPTPVGFTVLRAYVLCVILHLLLSAPCWLIFSGRLWRMEPRTEEPNKQGPWQEQQHIRRALIFEKSRGDMWTCTDFLQGRHRCSPPHPTIMLHKSSERGRKSKEGGWEALALLLSDAMAMSDSARVGL